jgi:hypothetical protein
MADPGHLEILKQGVEAWNRWRRDNPNIRPNLRKASLRGGDFRNSNFNDANLRRVDLSHSDLTGASFRRADLRRAKLSNCLFRNADLTSAILIETSLENSVLSGCLVYGVSAWSIRLKGAEQKSLIVSKKNSPVLAVDSIEVAQFIYLLLNNQKIRDVISTIGQKAVLILGRFSPPERKEVLDAIADKLRQLGFLPILFDFEGSVERDFTETIRILAGLSLFVIADITNPKSAPLELQAIVPDYMIPFVPILQKGEPPFSMFKDLAKYKWVLEPRAYDSKQTLLDGLEEAVIKPALRKHAELVSQKAESLKVRSIEDFMNDLKLAKDAVPEESGHAADPDELDD